MDGSSTTNWIRIGYASKVPRRYVLVAALVASMIFMMFFVVPQVAHGSTQPSRYEAPPSFFPVVYISGTEYEMGYQYGYQAGKYISIVKDSLWSSLLERYDRATILNNLAKYEEYVSKELPRVKYLEILKGMADGAQAAGYNVTYQDILLINYQVEFEWMPLPGSCTNLAAWGKATSGGKLIAGSNFDYPRARGYSYIVMVIAYPKNGNAFVSFGIAGRLGDNFQMNDKGLIHESNKGPNARHEDMGYGITDFILGPYMAMTCSNADEAKDVIMSITPTNGINHLLADVNGHGYVIETTHSLKAIRSGIGKGYVISANHFMNTTMKPAQKPWDPAKYYRSSWYRYITAEKYIQENYGKVDYKTVMGIMSSTDYWNGTTWIRNAAWKPGSYTINRFGPWGGTFESKVAIPKDRVLYVCAGNPGHPQWGRLAPGFTGQYVKIYFKDSPLATTKALRSAAESELYLAAHAIDNLTAKNDWSKVLVNGLFDKAKSKYWDATRKMVLAELSSNKAESLKLYGEASTEFAEVQGISKYIRGMSVVLPPGPKGSMGPQGPPGEPAPMAPLWASIVIAIVAIIISGIAIVRTRIR